MERVTGPSLFDLAAVASVDGSAGEASPNRRAFRYVQAKRWCPDRGFERSRLGTPSIDLISYFLSRNAASTIHKLSLPINTNQRSLCYENTILYCSSRPLPSIKPWSLYSIAAPPLPLFFSAARRIRLSQDGEGREEAYPCGERQGES